MSKNDWVGPEWVEMTKAVRNSEFGYLWDGLTDFAIISVLSDVIEIYKKHNPQVRDYEKT